MRLAIVSTHPIQYHAPWFRLLAREPGIDLEVLYCHRATPQEQGSAGFGVEFDWDRSLLDGYSNRFLRNVAPVPSVHHFRGLDTPELAEILDPGRYDAVMVTGWHFKSAWQAIRTCWRKRIPVMARSDSHLYTPRSPLKRIAKEIPYRWFIRKLDACLAVGRWSSEYFLHYGADRDRVFVVPYMVDPAFLRDGELSWEERMKVRAGWGFRETDTVFLFPGKFIGRKRPADFIQAIAAAAQRHPGIVGVMVGDGPLRPECERIAGQLAAPVHFAGFLNQSQIGKAYAASDALVLPSDGGETWGLVINEAMSAGCPCIVTDRVGAGPDLVVPEKTGFVYPLGDIAGLTRLLVEWSAQPERAQHMRRLSRVQVQTYSQTAVEGLRQALDRAARS